MPNAKVFFIVALFALCVRVVILVTGGNTVHDLIILLRGAYLVHKNSLTPPILIGVSVPIHETEWPCMCVLDRYSVAKRRPVKLDLAELSICAW